MKKVSYAVIMIILIVYFSGCAKPDPVESVKAMVMSDFPTTTIGKAFDAAFDNPAWKSFETDNGQTVVEFTGTVTEEMHERVSQFIWDKMDKDNRAAKAIENGMIETVGLEELKNLVQNHPDAKSPNFEPIKVMLQYYIDQYQTSVNSPVTFQWMLNIKDHKTANLGHFSCGDGSWKGVGEKFVLSLVYN